MGNVDVHKKKNSESINITVNYGNNKYKIYFYITVCEIFTFNPVLSDVYSGKFYVHNK